MATVLGDLGNAVLIILVFSLLQLFLAVGSGIANIRQNWDMYKCNPSIMPFASVFGKNTQENFNECIKQNQLDFMGGFLQPIYGALTMFAQTGQEFSKNFEDMKIFGNKSENGSRNFISEAGARVNMFGNEGGNLIGSVQNAFSKLSSSLSIFFQLAQSPQQLANSLGNSIFNTAYEAIPGSG